MRDVRVDASFNNDMHAALGGSLLPAEIDLKLQEQNLGEDNCRDANDFTDFPLIFSSPIPMPT